MGWRGDHRSPAGDVRKAGAAHVPSRERAGGAFTPARSSLPRLRGVPSPRWARSRSGAWVSAPDAEFGMRRSSREAPCCSLGDPFFRQFPGSVATVSEWQRRPRARRKSEPTHAAVAVRPRGLGRAGQLRTGGLSMRVWL